MATPSMPRRLAAILVLPLATLLASPVLGVTVAQPWLVEGVSMEPAIEDGSVLLVDAVGPRITGYAHGDVVVLRLPDDVAYDARVLVKRIVALPGDHLVIQGGQLFLDGVPVAEPYLWAAGPGGEAAASGEAAAVGKRPDEPRLDLVVPPDTVFVMGDHRANSFDSLAFGPLPAASLVGRAWIAVAPEGRLDLPGAVASDR